MSSSESLRSQLRSLIDEEVSRYEDPTEKGQAFLKWVLKNVFEKAEDESSIIDAPYDLGIDTYFESGEEDIYVVQSKYGASHSINAINQFAKDFENFQSVEIEKLNVKLHDLRKWLREGRKVRLIYITDNQVTEQEKQNALKIGIDVYDIDRIAQEIWSRSIEPYKGKIERLEILDKLNYGNYCICILPLKSLAEFIERTKEYIFQSNIRQWLQFRTKVNKGIRETLKNNPENFFKYNNGITLVCDDFKFINKKELELTSPQIVNGAQTCNAVWVSWKDDPNLKGEVLATIIRAVSIDDMRVITRYRNSQNAIRGKDFVSLEEFHREIKITLESLGYFYEIQTGSFALLEPKERMKYKGSQEYNKYLSTTHKGNISSKDAIQAYVAGFKQNPTDAYGRPSTFMPTGDKYKEAFPYDLQHDYRLFLYPYLVREYAKAHLNYGTREEGKEWKVNSTLFFVAIYFKLLARLLDYEGDLTKMDLNKIEKIFKDFNLNEKILKLTDKVISEFMKDSQVFNRTMITMKVGETTQRLFDYPTFFKTHAYKEEFKQIIEFKISLFEHEISQLKNQINIVLNINKIEA